MMGTASVSDNLFVLTKDEIINAKKIYTSCGETNARKMLPICHQCEKHHRKYKEYSERKSQSLLRLGVFVLFLQERQKRSRLRSPIKLIGSKTEHDQT